MKLYHNVLSLFLTAVVLATVVLGGVSSFKQFANEELSPEVSCCSASSHCAMSGEAVCTCNNETQDGCACDSDLENGVTLFSPQKTEYKKPILFTLFYRPISWENRVDLSVTDLSLPLSFEAPPPLRDLVDTQAQLSIFII